MKLRITVEGQTYEVEVEVLSETRHEPPVGASAVQSVARSPTSGVAATGSSPPPAAATAPISAAPGSHVVEAPIVGTIMQLKVAAGETVAVNQVLLVMEAMKMETNIASPMAGKIKAIHVAPGQAVKAGQVLIEFE